MAKFFELTEENQKLIDRLFEESGLNNYVNLILLGTTKAKEVIKVAKTNPIAEKLGNCPDSVVCIVYEDAFDRLDDNAKRLITEDVLSTISYDFDKDKIVVGCPCITITQHGRAKYGENLINAVESGLFAIQQLEEERKAKKEREK